MTIRVALAGPRDASYDILIGRGLLADLPALVSAACPASRYAVITDSHVAKLYAETLVPRFHEATVPVELFEFPAGEWNKTRETWASLSDRMLSRQFGRDCGVIALGGGVVGDVAGFVAATYLRGVPCIQVPTTLLAMIDSSIGGKTGVDVPAGKNLLGAFHQPRLVVTDLDVLGSLSLPQLAAGMAEAVKHGVIADREATSKFATPHGEAVAIGMAYEARLAEALGIAEPGTADRVQRLLERYNLPLDLPESATEDALVGAMQLDKKAREGAVRFALPQAIGRMYAEGKSWTVAAPESVVREVLRRPGE